MIKYLITMDFDRMGRRVFYKEEVNGEVVAHHRFVYDNYLCVQKLDALNNNSQLNLFVWDPTEPVATRPLLVAQFEITENTCILGMGRKWRVV